MILLGRGMDIELIRQVGEAVDVPVIFGGGVGCVDDIIEAADAGADAIACASVFHYDRLSIEEIKKELINKGVNVRT